MLQPKTTVLLCSRLSLKKNPGNFLVHFLEVSGIKCECHLWETVGTKWMATVEVL